MYLPDASTPGDECALCIGGALTRPPDDSGLILLGGEDSRAREGMVCCVRYWPCFGRGSVVLIGNDLGDGQTGVPDSSSSDDEGNSISSARTSESSVCGRFEKGWSSEAAERVNDGFVSGDMTVV
jgi:hypothetical protein